jgi:ABC-2 type transport system permease protein
MTTSTLTTMPATAGSAPRLAFSGILRSEWIKLHSLWSTGWLYASVIAISLALGALAPSLVEDAATASRAEVIEVTASGAAFGILFSQLVVAALGVISMTGEYSTGQIKSSLTAVPRRLRVLGAKATILFVSSFIVGVVSAAGGAAVAAAILASRGGPVTLAEPEVFASVLWTGFYLAMVAVFSLGIGTVIRNTGGGIATALAVILVLPIVFSLAPVAWMQDASAYLLSNAGMALAQGNSAIETWQLMLTVVGWAAASTAVGAVLLRRRDA